MKFWTLKHDYFTPDLYLDASFTGALTLEQWCSVLKLEKDKCHQALRNSNMFEVKEQPVTTSYFQPALEHADKTNMRQGRIQQVFFRLMSFL
ncbi:MAG: hypothetical protein WD077_04900 [Bacteroidia bacterium]